MVSEGKLSGRKDENSKRNCSFWWYTNFITEIDELIAKCYMWFVWMFYQRNNREELKINHLLFNIQKKI